MQIKHYIITRFNYSKDYEHLEERIAIFKSFTMPSIKAQTNQNFEWLILGKQLVDVPGARWFAEQPDEPLRPGRMNTIYLDYIKRANGAGYRVLMTRFDNDDVLLPSFVEDVQKIGKDMSFGLIDFRGYRLDLTKARGPRWQNRFYKDIVYNETFTSPMITLVQTRVRKTIYKCNHAKMAGFFPVTYVEKPNWVQIVHGSNWLMATKHVRMHSVPIVNTHPFVKKLMEDYHAKSS